jgi:hypothetical protein
MLPWQDTGLFLISIIHRVVNVVFFLLGDSRASGFYAPTFRNTVSYTFKGSVNKRNLLPVHTTYEDGRD